MIDKAFLKTPPTWASVTFRVEGKPMGQPRPRAFTRKFGDKVQARVYDAGTAEGWKGLVAVAARPFRPASPITGPVRLDAIYLFPRPQALMRKKDPDGRVLYHLAKPDRDNLDKAMMDGLVQLGFLRDDAIVCDGRIQKLYVAKGEAPGAIVTIRWEAC